ncbi:T9SS type B sorting domain-containing protein [uncultured Flavobacterium sp.]|uniref:T9SS type B sorting domain-containing protein n=1 Tax=uncultured Flavobacterium sp. TaxID=165435 RepID=UPI0030C85148
MKNLLLIFLLLITSLGYSQNEANNWYFGYNAGLDFSSGAPVLLPPSSMFSEEGCTSISNPAGQLLFYSNGMQIWNSNHQLMPNGSGLLGHDNSGQSCIAVPKPNASNIYYLFTTDAEGHPQGLRYSEIDMNLDGGLGDVTATKNVLLQTPVGEKLTAIRTPSGDYWVVSMLVGYADFVAYKVTSSGVDTANPVITNVTQLNLEDVSMGNIKFSPDGTKLLMANSHGKVFLLDFNSNTGVFSNPKLVYNFTGVYGVEFSPSGNIGYVTRGQLVLQFDLTAANIPSTQTVIHDTGVGIMGVLQLAPDLKIYCCLVNTQYISAIQDPDVLGVGCNFDFHNIDVSPMLVGCEAGLPQFIYSYFNSGILAQNNCLGESTNFELSNSQSVISVVWDFGDGSTTSSVLNPSHTYANSGTFTVSATISTTTETITRTKQITISEIPVVANTVANQDFCGTAAMSYDLEQFNATVIGSQSTTTFGVAYFSSQTNAENHTNILTNTQNLPLGTTTYYAKIYNLDNPNCYAITSFEVTLYNQPIANTVSDYIICEAIPYDGIEQFDLQTKNALVLGSQSATNFSISYHTSQNDADTNNTALPFLYTNTLPQETIYVRIENNLNADCFATTSFNIEVIQQPTVSTVTDYVLCDDASNNGIEQFDLTTKTNEILNGQSTTVFEVSYYLTLSDAQNNTNAIITPINNATNNQDIYYSITAIGNANCKVIDSFKIVVSNLPIANIPNDIFICDDITNDGFGTFDLTQNNSVILGNQSAANFTVTYYENQNDAENAVNPLNTSYSNTSNPQTIFVRIENNNNSDCYDTTSFQIGLYELPIAYQPQNMHSCDTANDVTEIFDLSQQTAIVLGSQSPTDFTVSYHQTQQEADNNTNPLPANYSSTQPSKTIYVRIENVLSTTCYNTTSFQLIIHPNPVLNINQTYTICEGNPIVISAPSGFSSYNWSTGSTSNQAIISQAGQYTLTVTKDYGTIICSTTENITVVNSNVATITEITTEDWTDNNNVISIFANGDGDYEYSLNGITYQDSSVFTNLVSGQYTVFVRDKNGCGIQTDSIYLLIYPKFFTPNNDGYNDYWKIKFSNDEPNIKTEIFDRYGKLIHVINGNLNSWDGTFNGTTLPATDYWFIVTRENGKEFRGHFTLKR